MGRLTRTGMRLAARTLRTVGEQVILLVNPTDSNSSTTTPLDPTIANESINYSLCTKIVCYAKVTYHKLGEINYQEGGRAVFRKADIETTAEWAGPLQQCCAVQLMDGSILRKESDNISETRALYTITCSGMVGIPQTI